MRVQKRTISILACRGMGMGGCAGAYYDANRGLLRI